MNTKSKMSKKSDMMSETGTSRPELAEESSSSSSDTDEALYDMLGLASVDGIDMTMNEEEANEDSADDDTRPRSLARLLELSESELRDSIHAADSINQYTTESVCSLPTSLCLDPVFMRRVTDELSWAGDKYHSDKTYETIRSFRQGEIMETRKITRFEDFVRTHDEWTKLCDYIGRLVSIVCGRPMALFKEKLNLKPPGGSGFAPHLDGPSLRVALGGKGPQEYVTVMVAIDSMTDQNGCLQFVRGPWSEENALETVTPDSDGNPDSNGRAGAIPSHVADALAFEPHMCDGGSIVLFNAWTPHRSSANRSPFPRRAVFLTYNPLDEGDCHDAYYAHMDRLRTQFREKAGIERRLDAQTELAALSTIPKV